MSEQDDIKMIDAMQKLGHGLRRTGITMLVLAATAFVGIVIDDTVGAIVTGIALGLIGAQSLFMLRAASAILHTIDTATMAALLNLPPARDIRGQ